MTAADLEAIIGGYHGNPFSILGPHQISIEKNAPSPLEPAAPSAWEVRAFLPQARSATVVLNGASSNGQPSAGQAIAMEKIRDQGFFVATLDRDPGHYRFEIEGWHGAKSLMEDAYRFPPLLSAFDIHLSAEGTLYEAWHSYGAHLATVEGVDGVRFAVWRRTPKLFR